MRRLYRAEAAERERVVHVLTAALEAEPDVEFAWLHGSFLGGGGFHDVDVGVHLNAAVDVRPRRALDLGLCLDRDTGFPVDVRELNDAPVTFLFHVFRGGRLLFSRNDERLADPERASSMKRIDHALSAIGRRVRVSLET